MHMNKLFYSVFAVLALLAVAAVPVADDSAAAEGSGAAVEYQIGDTSLTLTGQTAVAQFAALNVNAPAGMHFLGWYKVVDGTADESVLIAEGSALAEGSSFVFRASFGWNAYTATFVNGDETSTIDIRYGDVITEADGLVTVTRTVDGEATVIGTYTEPTDTDTATYDGLTPAIGEGLTVTESVTFTAVYTPVYAVTWTYGAYSFSGTSVAPNEPAVPTYAHMVFVGWFDARGVQYSADYRFVGDTVFTAKFNPEVLTVTFAYQDGRTVEVPVMYGYVLTSAPAADDGMHWDADLTAPVKVSATIGEVQDTPAPTPAPAKEPTVGTDDILLAAVVLFLLGVVAVFGVRKLMKKNE